MELNQLLGFITNQNNIQTLQQIPKIAIVVIFWIITNRIQLHLILMICLLYGIMTVEKEEQIRRSECIEIKGKNLQFQTTQKLDYNSVSMQNDTFVDRIWLQELIEERIISKRGVHLVAEPFYGKTSMISKLLIADESSIWFKLHNTVIFSHICRFDRSITQNPSIFIHNLARALLNEFPMMCSNEIFSNDFNETLCSSDTVSCFDHWIIRPLKFYRTRFASRRYTLVIDALDECQVTSIKYDILDLLSIEMNAFPTQFAFILTSRNIEDVKSKFRGVKNMSLIQLADYKEQIDNDILSYILMRNLSLRWYANANLLVEQFNGNFLYAKYFLDYCLQEPACFPTDIPVSLHDKFEFNLIRIFGKNGGNFNEIRPFIEVLTAASKPLKEEMLIEISGIDSATNVFHIFGKEFRHFVKISRENSISFVHKEFRDYLTDYSFRYSMFFIDKYKGHKRYANYLFRALNMTSNIEVIDLVHHVALSKSNIDEDFLLQHLQDILHYNSMPSVSYIHQTAMTYNCYHTMALILKFVGLIHIDDKNSDNKTASFLAAEYGHNNTLKALLDFGADVNFQVPCNTDIVFNLLYYDTFFYCECSLLDIAAIKGHHTVVRLLLSGEYKLSDYDIHTRASYYKRDLMSNKLIRTFNQESPDPYTDQMLFLYRLRLLREYGVFTLMPLQYFNDYCFTGTS